MNSWTASGDYISLTDKEKIISTLEDEYSLSDRTCSALKKVKVAELEVLKEELWLNNRKLQKTYLEGTKEGD